MPDALAVAIEAARAAGAVHRAGVLGDIAVKENRTSIVTATDHAAQAEIARVIHAAFPADAILGEEGALGDVGAARVWIVDPLDGTTNYAHGLPLFCASVALRDATGLVAGAIHAAASDELFAARRGGGATLNGEPIRVSGEAQLGRALVATQLQSDDAARIAAYAQRVGRLHGAARGVRTPGSPALCLASVACGRLDAFCEDGLKPWDVAGGALIVAEAGGTVSGFDGGVLPLAGSCDVVASNGAVHSALLALVAG